MTLTELATRLENNLQDGRIELKEAALGLDKVVKLLNEVAGGSLEIKNAQIVSTDSQLMVSGTSSLLKIADLPVTATFVSVGDKIECCVVTSLPSSWTFAQSFPDLPSYVNYSPAHCQ